jgi:hypothetical protein
MPIFRSIVLSIIATLSISLSYAQNTFTFAIPNTYFPPPTQSGSLKVIDARTNTEDIGHLRTGAFNRYAAIQTDQSITEFFSTYYKKLNPKPGSKYQLLLVLYNIDIHDRPSGAEVGVFQFNGDFFVGENGKYKFIRNLDTLCEVTSAWDVSHKLIDLAQTTTGTILSKLGSVTYGKEGTTYTETEAKDRRINEKKQFPIYNTTDYKKGIYFTADQFLQNQPVDTEFIVQDFFRNDGPRQISFYYPNKKGKKGEKIDNKTFFAVYTGSQWYVAEKYPVRMKYENDDFIAVLPFRGIKGPEESIMLFGMVGGLVAATGKETWATYTARFDPIRKEFVPVKRGIK